MMRRLLAVLLGGFVCVVASARPLWAEDCALQRIPVDLVPNQNGVLMASMKIGDKPALFKLETADFWSMINPKWAEGLTRHVAHVRMKIGNQDYRDYVHVSDLMAGSINLGAHDLFVAPAGYFSDNIAGLLGASFLQGFDVEINLAENKFNLFLPLKCDVSPVYWPHDTVAEIPIEEDEWRRIFVKLLIDGERVRTLLTTGYPTSFLTLSTASNRFDLSPDSPGMDVATTWVDHDGVTRHTYRHQFQSLEMEGVVFKRPWIVIGEDKTGRSENLQYEFLLGMHQLRDLHVYISYAHHKLYVTKAAAVVADSPEGNDDHPRATKPQNDYLDQALIQPYLNRAKAAADAGYADLALSAYDDLVNHFPKYPQVFYYRAQYQMRLKAWDAARSDLDQAIVLLPTYADAYRLRSEARRLKHDEEGAKADLAAAVGYDPKSSPAFVLRSDERLRGQDLDGALADAQHAIDLDPNNGAAYIRRGRVFYQQKDYDRALADFRRATNWGSSRAAGFDGVGRVLYHQGKMDESAESFAHAVELAPNQEEYRNDSCWYLALMERYNQALAQCNSALDLNPKGMHYFDSRAYVFLKLHRLKEALSDYDAALALDSNFVHALYGRSLAKQALGDVNGAKADLAAATQKQPDIAQTFVP